MSRTRLAAVLIVATLACSPVNGQELEYQEFGTQEIPLCNNILPSYLQYVQNKCILPTNGITDTCKQLTKTLCGDIAMDTLNGYSNPCTAEPGSYIYPLANYYNKGVFKIGTNGCQYDLSCKHSLLCPVVAVDSSTVRCDIYDPTFLDTVGSIDPNSLVAWAKYIQTCYGSNYNPATTSPATCSQLSGDLCSRPDVLCDGVNTFFKNGADIKSLSSDPGSCTVSSLDRFVNPVPPTQTDISFNP